MKLSISNYLFLSQYFPLPLSALKPIEESISHPFHNIGELNAQAINKELKKLTKMQNVVIRDISKKAVNASNLIKESILEKITTNLEEWKAMGIITVPFFSKKYPIKLRNIKNPPKVLFARGEFNLITRKAFSIVGTRNPTEYGKKMAFKIGYCLAEMGFTVINGFAKGVDIEAIKGGLKAGGNIVGVFGSGLLNPYPKENIVKYNEILKNYKGLFISERLPEKSITKSSLAIRNRISSALSLGNIFIEGKRTSGTKWQLKYGKEQDKPIIVLKPKQHIEETELPRDIIKAEPKAYIIENIEDIEKIIESLTKIKNPRNPSITDYL